VTAAVEKNITEPNSIWNEFYCLHWRHLTRTMTFGEKKKKGRSPEGKTMGRGVVNMWIPCSWLCI